MTSRSELQKMTFREQALWELNQEKQKQKDTRKTFWVQVEFVDGRKHTYQLAKDLQKAMWEHVKEHPKKWREVLLGALINVPVSKYDQQGNAEIRTGKIIHVIIKKRHTSQSECVTRSQFLKPQYNSLGIAKYHQMFKYLRHDYNLKSSAHILIDILKIVPTLDIKKVPIWLLIIAISGMICLCFLTLIFLFISMILLVVGIINFPISKLLDAFYIIYFVVALNIFNDCIGKLVSSIIFSCQIIRDKQRKNGSNEIC